MGTCFPSILNGPEIDKIGGPKIHIESISFKIMYKLKVFHKNAFYNKLNFYTTDQFQSHDHNSSVYPINQICQFISQYYRSTIVKNVAMSGRVGIWLNKLQLITVFLIYVLLGK